MSDSLRGAWIPHRYSAEQLEEYEERRAILEFDAGMDAFSADFEARRICLERWNAAHPKVSS